MIPKDLSFEGKYKRDVGEINLMATFDYMSSIYALFFFLKCFLKTPHPQVSRIRNS